MTGPEQIYPDNFVNFLKDPSNNGVLGFTGNEQNFRLTGSRVDTAVIDSSHRDSNGDPISVLGHSDEIDGPFDSCGAWIKAAERINENTILTWYHAEGGPSEPERPRGCARKSIGFAISYDNGRSFQKFNYGDGRHGSSGAQVITSPNPLTEEAAGHGDNSVIKWGDHRYMYFWNAENNGNWFTSVARSGLWTWGARGQWFKYLDGNYNSPGIGGSAENLGYHGQSASVMANDGYRKVMLLGIDGGKGLTLSLADRPEGPFEQLKDPLIPFDQYSWLPRNSSSPALIAYPSANHLHGGNEWSNHFVLFYLYLEPGANFEKRYLVRQHVWVASPSATARETTVKLRLAQHYNAQRTDYWSTTSMTPNYQFQHNLGFLSTSNKNLDGSTNNNKKLLVDCYFDGWKNHLTEVGACTGQSKTLRKLGWIYSAPQSNTRPLYRCFNVSSQDHFLWNNESCNGQVNQHRVLLGYIEQ